MKRAVLVLLALALPLGYCASPVDTCLRAVVPKLTDGCEAVHASHKSNANSSLSAVSLLQAISDCLDAGSGKEFGVLTPNLSFSAYVRGKNYSAANLRQSTTTGPSPSFNFTLTSIATWGRTLAQTAGVRPALLGLEDNATMPERYDAWMVDPIALADMSEGGMMMDLSQVVLDPLYKANVEWLGIHQLFRSSVVVAEGTVSSLPFGGLIYQMYYRRDVLAAHGLSPPATWDEFLAVAKEVNGTDMNGDGVGDFGVCLQRPRFCFNGFNLAAMWSSFIQTQGTKQGAFFDPNTMVPLTNNSAFHKALSILVKLRDYGPPDESTAPCLPFNMQFVRGRCALTLSWGYQIKANNFLPYSAVRNKVGVALLPGSTNVLNRATGELEPCASREVCPYADNLPGGPNGTFRLVNRAPYLALATVSAAISSRASVSAQTSLLGLFAHLSSRNVSWDLVTSPLTELGPYRYEHFDPANLNQWVRRGYPARDIAEFLQVMKAQLDSDNVMLEVRTVEAYAYRRLFDVFATAVSEKVMDVPTAVLALSKELSTVYGPQNPRFATIKRLYRYSIGLLDAGTGASPPVGASPAPGSGGDPSGGGRSDTAVVAIVVPVAAVVLGAVVAAVAMYAVAQRKLGSKDREPKSHPGVGDDTTLVVSDVEGSTVLWEVIEPCVMDVVFDLHHDCMRRTAVKFRGYESQTEGDSFIISFHHADDAVQFSLAVQQALLEEAWPRELLAHEKCRPVWLARTTTEVPLDLPFEAPAAAAPAHHHHHHHHNQHRGGGGLGTSEYTASRLGTPTAATPGSGAGAGSGRMGSGVPGLGGSGYGNSMNRSLRRLLVWQGSSKRRVHSLNGALDSNGAGTGGGADLHAAGLASALGSNDGGGATSTSGAASDVTPAEPVAPPSSLPVLMPALPLRVDSVREALRAMWREVNVADPSAWSGAHGIAGQSRWQGVKAALRPSLSLRVSPTMPTAPAPQPSILAGAAAGSLHQLSQPGSPVPVRAGSISRAGPVAEARSVADGAYPSGGHAGGISENEEAGGSGDGICIGRGSSEEEEEEEEMELTARGIARRACSESGGQASIIAGAAAAERAAEVLAMTQRAQSSTAAVLRAGGHLGNDARTASNASLGRRLLSAVAGLAAGNALARAQAAAIGDGDGDSNGGGSMRPTVGGLAQPPPVLALPPMAPGPGSVRAPPSARSGLRTQNFHSGPASASHHQLGGTVMPNPTPDQCTLVRRGLAVRIGMHTGIRHASDLVYSEVAARWKYSGEVLSAAKAVSDAANGGDVLLGCTTLDRLSPELFPRRSLCLLYLGRHVLRGGDSPAAAAIAAASTLPSPPPPPAPGGVADLWAVYNARMLPRMGVYRPPRTAVPMGLSTLDAPLGRLAYAYLVSPALADLALHSDGCGEAVTEAQAALGSIAADQLLACHGVPATLSGGSGGGGAHTGGGGQGGGAGAAGVLVGGGSVAAAFRNPYHGILFALQAQEDLLRHPWSSELLAHEHFEAIVVPAAAAEALMSPTPLEPGAAGPAAAGQGQGQGQRSQSGAQRVTGTGVGAVLRRSLTGNERDRDRNSPQMPATVRETSRRKLLGLMGGGISAADTGSTAVSPAHAPVAAGPGWAHASSSHVRTKSGRSLGLSFDGIAVAPATVAGTVVGVMGSASAAGGSTGWLSAGPSLRTRQSAPGDSMLPGPPPRPVQPWPPASAPSFTTAGPSTCDGSVLDADREAMTATNCSSSLAAPSTAHSQPTLALSMPLVPLSPPVVPLLTPPPLPPPLLTPLLTLPTAVAITRVGLAEAWAAISEEDDESHHLHHRDHTLPPPSIMASMPSSTLPYANVTFSGQQPPSTLPPPLLPPAPTQPYTRTGGAGGGGGAPAASEGVGAGGSGSGDMTLFRGPRIKAAITYGPFKAHLDPLTGRIRYEGKAAAQAVKMVSYAAVGMVVASVDAVDAGQAEDSCDVTLDGGCTASGYGVGTPRAGILSNYGMLTSDCGGGGGAGGGDAHPGELPDRRSVSARMRTVPGGPQLGHADSEYFRDDPEGPCAAVAAAAAAAAAELLNMAPEGGGMVSRSRSVSLDLAAIRRATASAASIGTAGASASRENSLAALAAVLSPGGAGSWRRHASAAPQVLTSAGLPSRRNFQHQATSDADVEYDYRSSNSEQLPAGPLLGGDGGGAGGGAGAGGNAGAGAGSRFSSGASTPRSGPSISFHYSMLYGASPSMSGGGGSSGGGGAAMTGSITAAAAGAMSSALKLEGRVPSRTARAMSNLNPDFRPDSRQPSRTALQRQGFLSGTTSAQPQPVPLALPSSPEGSRRPAPILRSPQLPAQGVQPGHLGGVATQAAGRPVSAMHAPTDDTFALSPKAVASAATGVAEYAAGASCAMWRSAPAVALVASQPAQPGAQPAQQAEGSNPPEGSNADNSLFQVEPLLGVGRQRKHRPSTHHSFAPAVLSIAATDDSASASASSLGSPNPSPTRRPAAGRPPRVPGVRHSSEAIESLASPASPQLLQSPPQAQRLQTACPLSPPLQQYLDTMGAGPGVQTVRRSQNGPSAESLPAQQQGLRPMRTLSLGASGATAAASNAAAAAAILGPRPSSGPGLGGVRTLGQVPSRLKRQISVNTSSHPKAAVTRHTSERLARKPSFMRPSTPSYLPTLGEGAPHQSEPEEQQQRARSPLRQRSGPRVYTRGSSGSDGPASALALGPRGAAVLQGAGPASLLYRGGAQSASVATVHVATDDGGEASSGSGGAATPAGRTPSAAAAGAVAAAASGVFYGQSNPQHVLESTAAMALAQGRASAESQSQPVSRAHSQVANRKLRHAVEGGGAAATGLYHQGASRHGSHTGAAAAHAPQGALASAARTAPGIVGAVPAAAALYGTSSRRAFPLVSMQQWQGAIGLGAAQPWPGAGPVSSSGWATMGPNSWQGATVIAGGGAGAGAANWASELQPSVRLSRPLEAVGLDEVAMTPVALKKRANSQPLVVYLCRFSSTQHTAEMQQRLVSMGHGDPAAATAAATAAAVAHAASAAAAAAAAYSTDPLVAAGACAAATSVTAALPTLAFGDVAAAGGGGRDFQSERIDRKLTHVAALLQGSGRLLSSLGAGATSSGAGTPSSHHHQQSVEQQPSFMGMVMRRASLTGRLASRPSQADIARRSVGGSDPPGGDGGVLREVAPGTPSPAPPAAASSPAAAGGGGGRSGGGFMRRFRRTSMDPLDQIPKRRQGRGAGGTTYGAVTSLGEVRTMSVKRVQRGVSISGLVSVPHAASGAQPGSGPGSTQCGAQAHALSTMQCGGVGANTVSGPLLGGSTANSWIPPGTTGNGMFAGGALAGGSGQQQPRYTFRSHAGGTQQGVGGAPAGGSHASSEEVASSGAAGGWGAAMAPVTGPLEHVPAAGGPPGAAASLSSQQLYVLGFGSNSNIVLPTLPASVDAAGVVSLGSWEAGGSVLGGPGRITGGRPSVMSPTAEEHEEGEAD